MEQAISKISIMGFLGAVGGYIAALLGGWSTDLVTLVIFMAIDYMMGVAIALLGKSHKTENGALESKQMFAGLVKKGIMLTIVLVAYRLDLLLGFDFVRTATIISFLANEAVSIIENAGILGVPFPPVIKRTIEVLKAKADEKGEKNND